MSVEVIVRLEKQKKSTKELPVCVRIIQNRRTMYKTICHVLKDNWDFSKNEVKKSDPNAQEKNCLLSSKKAEFEKVVLRQNIDSGEFTIESIRTQITKRVFLDFFEYAESYNQQLQERGNYALYKRYKTIVDKFKRYCQSEKMDVRKINAELINSYRYYLTRELRNCPNTITSNLKIISKYIRDIYHANKLDEKENPFNNIKLKLQETNREHLTPEEIGKIESLKLTPLNRLYDAKEIFLFENYTGIRIADILTLKWKSYKGKELRFLIRKTKKNIILPLCDKADRMIQIRQHRLRHHKIDINPDAYIFNILPQNFEKLNAEEALNAINSSTAIINAKLKEIAVAVGIKKKISTHVGRHTFATTLISRGAGIYDVQELLGHANIKTTMIYAKVVDERKRKVINLLN